MSLLDYAWPHLERFVPIPKPECLVVEGAVYVERIDIAIAYDCERQSPPHAIVRLVSHSYGVLPETFSVVLTAKEGKKLREICRGSPAKAKLVLEFE